MATPDKDRKTRQRQRDAELGWQEIQVKVPFDRVQEVRELVSSMSPPPAVDLVSEIKDLADEFQAEVARIYTEACQGFKEIDLEVLDVPSWVIEAIATERDAE